MIPGSNLLKSALGLIAKQTLTYYKFSGRTQGASGKLVSSYDAPLLVAGSFQPMDDKTAGQLGLEFNKSYFNFYVPVNVLGVSRDYSGDQLLFGEFQYQVVSTTEWHAIDGWNALLCIKVPKTLG